MVVSNILRIFVYYLNKNETMTLIHVELPRRREICYIPPRQYKEYTWEMLEDTDLSEMDLVDLADFIEDVAEQYLVTPDGEFCDELRKYMNTAAKQYNALIGGNIMIVEPGGPFLSTFIGHIKPEKRTIKKLAKHLMIERVKDIKRMLKNNTKPAEIARATNLSTTFISKVKTGSKYPEVTI